MRRSLSRAFVGAALALSVGVLTGASDRQAGAGPPEPRRGGVELPGRYIVTYAPSAESPGAETDARERRQGFEADHVYRRAVEGFAAELSPGQVDRLEADPEIATVVPDRRVEPSAALVSGEPAPPAGVRRTGAASKRDVRGASGARVAVIDTGVDLDHPDLDVEAGKNCVAPGAPPEDDDGHGTHVAGTIAAENDGSGVVGVAPGTRIVAVKVFGKEDIPTASDVICGIDWVTSTRTDSDPDNDVDVANMSLGGGGPEVEPCAKETDPEHLAVCASTAAGITNVVAAGNDAWDFDYAPEPDVPAAYPEVLTVTAMGDSDGQPGAAGRLLLCPEDADPDEAEPDDGVAHFSNWARTPAGVAHTISAPGVCVRSSWRGGGHETISGTSMATPHVAGAVALCLDEAGEPGPCAGLSPAAIIQKMRSDAATRAQADPGYGFKGDAASPVARRVYGPLVWTGGAASDLAAPRIERLAPASGQLAVPITDTVTVAFDEYMDKASAQAAFSLTRAGGAAVPGTFSWRGMTMTFRALAPLGERVSYTAAVSAAAKDVRGNPLAEARTWTFRTAIRRAITPVAGVAEVGRRTAGSHAQLGADDNRFMQLASTSAGTPTTSWYGRFTGIPNGLTTLRVTERGRSSAQCTQAISIYSWTSRRWVALDARALGSNETTVDRAVPGPATDYVSGAIGPGEARVRVRCTRSQSSFLTSTDVLRLTFERP